MLLPTSLMSSCYLHVAAAPARAAAAVSAAAPAATCFTTCCTGGMMTSIYQIHLTMADVHDATLDLTATSSMSGMHTPRCFTPFLRHNSAGNSHIGCWSGGACSASPPPVSAWSEAPPTVISATMPRRTASPPAMRMYPSCSIPWQQHRSAAPPLLPLTSLGGIGMTTSTTRST
jgi:hypothetical protein